MEGVEDVLDEEVEAVHGRVATETPAHEVGGAQGGRRLLVGLFGQHDEVQAHLGGRRGGHGLGSSTGRLQDDHLEHGHGGGVETGQ